MDNFRKLIDGIDDTILVQLQQRAIVVKKIAEEKHNNGCPVRDLKREEQIINEVKSKALELGLNPQAVEKIFRIIIDDSAELQEKIIENNGNKNRPTDVQPT